MSWQRVMTRYNAGRTGGDESWSLDLARRAHFLEGAALLYDAAEDLESASERQDLEAAADALLNLAAMKWAGVTDELRDQLARLLVRHYGPRLLDGILLARRRSSAAAFAQSWALAVTYELRDQLEEAGVELSRDEGNAATWFRRGDQAAMISDVELATAANPLEHLAGLLEALGLLELETVDLGPASGVVLESLELRTVDQLEASLRNGEELDVVFYDEEPRDGPTAHEVSGDGTAGALRRAHRLGLLDADDLEAALEAVAGRQDAYDREGRR